jgi:methionine-rich copper-binding protein CopC
MLILLMSGSGTAAAHTALAGSDPAKDATVTAARDAIVLTFTEDINSAFANVVLSNAHGRRWESTTPDVEGPRLTFAIGPDRPGNSVYTVGYRVVSADGHPVTGSYEFTIAGVPDERPPTSTPAAASPSTTTAPPSAAPLGSDTKTTVIGAGVAGLALGGLIAFWQWQRTSRKNTAFDKSARQSTPPFRDVDAS